MLDDSFNKATVHPLTPTDTVSLMCTGSLGDPSPVNTTIRTLVVDAMADLFINLENDSTIAEGSDKEQIAFLKDTMVSVNGLAPLVNAAVDRQKQAILARQKATEEARKDRQRGQRDYFREKARRGRSHR